MHEESDTFSYHVEKYHTILSHTQPPQNQYSSPLHLNKSQIDSVKHTKPIKAPAYTHTLPDIGNGECTEMVVEHEAQLSALLLVQVL